MTTAPVVKPPDFQAICKVDVEELRRKLLTVGEAVWDAEDARKENRFACFHDTRHIIARFIPNNQDPAQFYSTPFWAVWQPLLAPVLTRVAQHYGFSTPEFPKVMFARLAAHTAIDRHVDGAGSNLLTHKIHVPLVTNEAVWFEVGDRRFRLEEGQAYELNNIRPHGVRNDGATDRIHLIFEIMDLGLHPAADVATPR